MSAIKAIHASARSLNLDEDALRDRYERDTGKRSLRSMTPGEQLKVLQGLRADGAATNSKGRKPLTGPYAKKLQALWIAAWNLGIVRNPDDKALLAFVERQTKIENTRFLRDADDAHKAVEAVKGWMVREADVDWTVSSKAPAWANDPRRKIAVAQLDMAVKIGVFEAHELQIHGGANNIFSKVFGYPAVEQMTGPQWMALQNELGVLIRQKKAGGK